MPAIYELPFKRWHRSEIFSSKLFKFSRLNSRKKSASNRLHKFVESEWHHLDARSSSRFDWQQTDKVFQARLGNEFKKLLAAWINAEICKNILEAVQQCAREAFEIYLFIVFPQFHQPRPRVHCAQWNSSTREENFFYNFWRFRGSAIKTWSQTLCESRDSEHKQN